jgi:dipeptidyl aminopeptidase/acylaminoacyl peptidase
MHPIRRTLPCWLLCAACSPATRAAATPPSASPQQSGQQAAAATGAIDTTGARAARALAANSAGLDEFDQQRLFKRLTDIDFEVQLGEEMRVRKVEYAGADDMIVPAYLFAPKDTTRRYPAIILVHGGVHGDFEALYVPEVRALVTHGYVVIAPEYRGSTGYGRDFYDAIDYGGKEVEDVVAARDFLANLVPYADVSRLGIMGWSHGGFITLHSIFRRPELFKVAVAHVPVADLPTRMRMHSPEYRRIFANQPGFGGTVEQQPRAYIQRSPIAHARELRTPLLVHAADNDQDVFIVENRALRDSMVAAGMQARGLYTYREWHNPPGGHEFTRVDTPQARESWRETVGFLDKYLKP